ncbi:DrmB family protein [Aeribacillus sp. FSL K6-2848]|uniref:DrmB family protein n=1 Tax=Aeribacillus sp. FSL K6-2848 TaxID=2954612 RepID=UPI0030F7B8E3
MERQFGQLRPSQLLFYHGPGAIVDMLSGSVMIMAADLWDFRSKNVIEDERVRSSLGVPYLRLLNEDQEKISVTARPFPKWKVCPRCGMMTEWDTRECYYCGKENVKIELFPSRFVIACKHGHIRDFPWIEWLHEGEEECKKPILKMTYRGMAGSLSDMYVQCVKCRKQKSLANIMKFTMDCTGERPWIGDEEQDKEQCKEQMETVLRGASKLYTPIVFSTLSIPLSDGRVDNLIEKVNREKHNLLKIKDRSYEQFKQIALILLDITENELPAVEQILNGEYEQSVSYETIRKQEWNTIIKKNVDYLEETGFKSVEVEIHEQMKPYFSSIVKIESLPEIQVLRGFTRLHYLDPFDATEIPFCSIMKNSRSTDWLPAVKNLGEGIFFQFNIQKLLEWENKENVKQELSRIFERYNKRREQLGNSSIYLKARHILIHTFSHAMIQEFARFSGYATTSLRERLYCSDDMYGVLIYTASSDSEGGLGGLIELSKPEKLYPIFVRALEKMEYCSSDPHCSDARFEMQSTVNGAACHACGFVSETSCEWGNQLLDRRTLIPLNEGESLAFFQL